ncbi:addiction module toxin RelE [Zavarzinia compransoris]|uniref:Addiction module toxin RelE n=1 Tax=Zavarzinia compransoris TaxID=1264899 RepID=A0A317E707_9PROT|nr:addiction module toxin RelE [Zavarzinia compransoris]
MHSVVETPEFLRAAAGLLDEGDKSALVDYLAANPRVGDLMPGTGGARKLRWAIGNRGKSGGVRTITYYAGEDVPVFLLTVYGKGEKANLTKAERNELREVLTDLAEIYRQGARA